MRFWFALFAATLFSPAALARTERWVCVDCYSTAALLPEVTARIVAEIKQPTGRDISIEWVHVQTHRYSPAFAAQVAAFPEGTVFLEGDFNDDAAVERIVQELRYLQVDRVLNSTTCEGNYQACRLNHLLGKPDDAFDTRDIRKTKLLQSAHAGPLQIPSHPLTTVEGALQFAAAQTSAELVMKFDGGGAGFGLKYLPRHDEAALRAIFAAVLASPPVGQFGQRDAIVLQPKIVGVEYHAQTFTHEGKTTLVALWRYYKVQVGDEHMYFLDRPVSLFSKEAEELRPHLQTLLENFGRKNGASHVEVMRDALGHWSLIEDNSRFVGGLISLMEKRIWGISQLELFVLSLLDPAQLRLELAKFPRPMQTDGALFIVPAPDAGTLKPVTVEELAALKTVITPPAPFVGKADRAVKRTTDLASAAHVLRMAGRTQPVRAAFELAYLRLVDGSLIEPQDCATYLQRADLVFPALEQVKATVDWTFRR